MTCARRLSTRALGDSRTSSMAPAWSTRPPEPKQHRPPPFLSPYLVRGHRFAKEPDMSAVVIVGAQWGDEGKGKIVDIFTEHADMVVRYGGGPNAGHTLVVGNDKLVVRLIPSGILRAQTTCVLAQGMAIDPMGLVSELDELGKRGLIRGGASLVVSDRAHAILPYHTLVDGLREQRPGALG